MKYYYILVSLLYCHTLSSQASRPVVPYEQIKFKNMTPNWYQTIYNGKMKGDTCDGYNFIFPAMGLNLLLDGENFFYALTTKTIKDLHTGTILQKRRISDGNLIWENAYDIKSIDRQEIPRYLSKSIDGNLKMINFIREKPYLVPDPVLFQIWSDSMIFSWRLFDKDNGDLLESYKSENSSPYLKYNRFFKNGSNLLTKNKSNLLKHIVYNNGTKNFYALDIDINNKVDLRDSFTLSQKGTNRFQLKVLSNNKYLIFDSFVSKNKKASVNIYKTTDRFDILEKGEAADSISAAYTLHLEDANEYGAIVSNFTGNVFDQSYEFLVFDTAGRLRQRNALDSLGRYFTNYVILDWDVDKPIYLLAFKNDVNNEEIYYNAIDVLKSNDKGGFDIVKRISSNEKKRLAIPVSILSKLNDNFIILFGELAYSEIDESKGIFTQDGNAKAYSLMSISEKELGIDLYSDTKEVAFNTNDNVPSITTNSNGIEIMFQKGFSGILSLYSTSGQVVRSLRVSNTDFVEVNTSGLISGLYFIMGSDKNANVFNHKILIIK